MRVERTQGHGSKSKLQGQEFSVHFDCTSYFNPLYIYSIFGLARSIYVQIGVCLFGRMSWFDPCKGPAALP